MSDDVLRVMVKTVTSGAFSPLGLTTAHQKLAPWPHDLYWRPSTLVLPLLVGQG